MREILFRGKRTDNGEWEYGDLWCNPYGKRVVCIVSPINDQGTTGGNEVDPETVGQYTGLTDKNGKKIFEGDIVITKTKSCEFIGCIAYSTEYVRFVCVTSHNIPYPMDSQFKYEVIGNIHDNHELLFNEENGG